MSVPATSIPRVAIVGRPNVGKSSLFNWLAGERLSIVDPTAGVTRDRLTHLMHEGDRYFELIDTGGIGIVDSDALEEEIEGQIRVGLEMADVLLFVGDAQTGVLPLDREVARRLHPLGKPVVIAANKCDSPKVETDAAEFLELFDAPLVTTTVKGNRGREELVSALLEALPPAGEHEAGSGAELATEPVMKLAVVGRRNVGKSTFLNALAGEERVIVSEVAGTTRDSIDLRFEVDGRALVAIDTPGVRRKKSLANDVEYYGTVRAQQSIRRADVVLMTFDATRTISKVDKQLVADIVEAHKPCIFVVNKWDLALEADMTSERWADYLEKTFANMRYVPVAFLTSQAGRNVRPVVDLAQSLFKQARERVGTGRLNSVVRTALEKNPPPMKKNRRPKIFFATQVAVTPPTIVLKCNEPGLFADDWKRYLLAQLRDQLPYPEIPIRLYFRSRGKDDAAESERR
ncbi:ribosome biogenesis GTPase Der [Alienimonas sp. DA493]|uniref:ribosome biogenesis GTPase Der n=1 Tax=Alienimonas sp. DA493 TaxID=3373605 RepID=UPI0037541791